MRWKWQKTLKCDFCVAGLCSQIGAYRPEADIQEPSYAEETTVIVLNAKASVRLL